MVPSPHPRAELQLLRGFSGALETTAGPGGHQSISPGSSHTFGLCTKVEHGLKSFMPYNKISRKVQVMLHACSWYVFSILIPTPSPPLPLISEPLGAFREVHTRAPSLGAHVPRGLCLLRSALRPTFLKGASFQGGGPRLCGTKLPLSAGGCGLSARAA